VGWLWRLGVGTLFCALGWFTALLVIGWLNRWMEAVAVRYWWKRGRLGSQGSFEDFCAGIGPDAPSPRPRWLLRNRIRATVNAPDPDGEAPGGGTVVLRLLTVPLHSLVRNIMEGVRGLAGTFVLAGWGCLLMLFAWEYGWLNSFTKGYERHYVGAGIGFGGIALFVAAMVFVPMAQPHVAVSRRLGAALDLRLLGWLIRARPLAYLGLNALAVGAAVTVVFFKTLPGFFYAPGLGEKFETMTDQELHRFIWNYTLFLGGLLFVSLVVLRSLAARVYASAVLRALHLGLVRADELPPRVMGWLNRTQALPAPGELSPWPLGVMGKFGRATVLTVLVLMWLGFVVAVYAGEFFNYHPLVGFLNHPSVMLPDVNYIPDHLRP
jgi:hypothetical protein